MKRLSTLALGLILCSAWAPAVFAQVRTSEGPVLVGRITYVDGQLLRYVYDERDWVATVKDAPFGLDDAVYSSDTGKAEFKLPNGMWVRSGSDTQIQLIALREDVSEIDVASGTVRLYNKSQKAVVKATTPYGYVLARPGCALDLYVGDESTEVISLNGAVDFVLGEEESRYVVEAGGASIISDGRLAIEGDGQVDAGWDEWNLKREELWTQRVQIKGESVDYLPFELRDDAYDLDQSGKWEQVRYDGRLRTLWRPTAVPSGWQPFTNGRWTVWYKDNVWIPEESFGYVTHHYGNWVLANSNWYWAPPVTVTTGSTGRCAHWYPGRVSWIHSDADVGWVPLAPDEIYYSHNYWGPASSIVKAKRGGGSTGTVRLAYSGYAVVVPRGSLYSVDSYSGVRVANISRTTIVKNYRVEPVISDRVIPNYNAIRNRYIYSVNLAILAAKPHEAVVARIDRNRINSVRVRRAISGQAVQLHTARIGRGELISGPQAAQRIQKPRITARIVPENMVHRPGSEVHFIQRSLKVQEKRPQLWPGFQKPGAHSGGERVPGAVSGGSAGAAERVHRGKSTGAGKGERQLRKQRKGRRDHGGQGLKTSGRKSMRRQGPQGAPQIQSPRPEKLRHGAAGQIRRPETEMRRSAPELNARRTYEAIARTHPKVRE
ncbi:MAG: DUF6600 domain-containing protein [Syntrophobacteraceae bacterium]|jgi:hypothetical protein